MSEPTIRALLFDVFGTCVDWRTGVIHEVGAIARRKRVAVDAAAFADAWRANYQPSMETVRSGQRPWTILDVLHRESLDKILPKFGLEELDEAERTSLNRVWHRLDPWRDTFPGLLRLKGKYIIAPLSNGNVALLTNMAKRAGLPWDLILSAETSRAYKPMRDSYLNAAAMLGLEPGDTNSRHCFDRPRRDADRREPKRRSRPPAPVRVHAPCPNRPWPHAIAHEAHCRARPAVRRRSETP
jgi:2-haloacid dehalogenase